MTENTAEHAETNFVVKLDGQAGGVRYVSAEAGTGYRYAVAVAFLPVEGRDREGGPMLVTVTCPWTDSHALQTTGYLSDRYIEEHLTGRPHRKVSDADLRAITLLVRYALDRT